MSDATQAPASDEAAAMDGNHWTLRLSRYTIAVPAGNATPGSNWEVPIMRFLVTDTAADSIATWAIEDEGRLVGTVSQTLRRRFRVSDAGPYCRPPSGDHDSRQAAARALLAARQSCQAEQVDASGLMRIERDVLAFEADHETTEDERQREAARLGISVISYRQIARRMRLDARAEAYSPKGVAHLREQYEDALARTARYRRPAAPALAEAS